MLDSRCEVNSFNYFLMSALGRDNRCERFNDLFLRVPIGADHGMRGSNVGHWFIVGANWTLRQSQRAYLQRQLRQGTLFQLLKLKCPWGRNYKAAVTSVLAM